MKIEGIFCSFDNTQSFILQSKLVEFGQAFGAKRPRRYLIIITISIFVNTMFFEFSVDNVHNVLRILLVVVAFVEAVAVAIASRHRAHFVAFEPIVHVVGMATVTTGLTPYEEVTERRNFRPVRVVLSWQVGRGPQHVPRMRPHIFQANGAPWQRFATLWTGLKSTCTLRGVSCLSDRGLLLVKSSGSLRELEHFWQTV